MYTRKKESLETLAKQAENIVSKNSDSSTQLPCIRTNNKYLLPNSKH